MSLASLWHRSSGGRRLRPFKPLVAVQTNCGIKNLMRANELISSLIGVTALSACSPPQVPAAPRQQAQAKMQFSDEDRRIARALSLGGGEIKKTRDPRFYATLCGLALASVAERMQNSTLLSAEQSRAFSQAQNIYARRAADGSTAAERQAVSKEVEADYPDPADRARFAIGCLRDLVQTGS